jgi:hypothetical protein
MPNLQRRWLGKHIDEILGDAGYSCGEIEMFRREAVV